jgi:hypothetical protein
MGGCRIVILRHLRLQELIVPKKENYPAYMAPDGENFRGINAVRVLSEENKYTIDKVIRAGYDKRLSAFEILVPALVSSFEKNVRQTIHCTIDFMKRYQF